MLAPAAVGAVIDWFPIPTSIDGIISKGLPGACEGSRRVHRILIVSYMVSGCGIASAAPQNRLWVVDQSLASSFATTIGAY